MADIVAEQKKEKEEQEQKQFTPVDRSRKTAKSTSTSNGKATVTASMGLTSVEGFSGNGGAASRLLKRIHHPLWNALTKKVNNKKTKGGGIFSCAEPDAVAKLINALAKGTDTDLSSITIGYTKNTQLHLIEAPCATCAQWVVSNGQGTYGIAQSIIDEVIGSTKKAEPAKTSSQVAISNPFDALLDEED
jgi:hypothetical protein